MELSCAGHVVAPPVLPTAPGPAAPAWGAAPGGAKPAAIDVGSVWEVVGSSGQEGTGLVVRGGKAPSSKQAGRLAVGAMVRALEHDADARRLRYELVAGEGPAAGWVTTQARGKDLLVRASGLPQKAMPPTAAPTARPTATPQAAAAGGKPDRAAAFWGAVHDAGRGDADALQRYREQFQGAKRGQPVCRTGAVAVVSTVGGEAPRSDRCPQCRLPVGDLAYHLDNDPEGPLVHGECQAQLMLQKSKEAEEARQQKDAELKRARREKYAIGWKAEMIPRNAGPVGKLGCAAQAQGMCCLTLDESTNSVRLAPTKDPATSINLEYLSLALQVRTRGGRDPMFSLDPKVGDASSPADLHAQWQVKRFEPEWLAGTSVGEVMFQADVHLKELSMGEYEQPVVGMKSCLEYLEKEGLKAEWCAREWFIVKKAEVLLTGSEKEGGALVPFVEMGVQAREQIWKPEGIEDAPLTRPDHPLVKYAEAFTRYFDLIAERKSAIRHIRELAKATVLAKFLVDSQAELDQAWFDLAEEAKDPGCMEIPQLWNERCHTNIQVKDGKILDVGKGTSSKLQGVYGGVEFGTDRVQVVGFRRPVAAVLTEIPRGVDLNLDKFNLSSAKRVAPVGGLSIFQSPEECAPIGSAFWPTIEPNAASVFSEVYKGFFRDLFNPHLSDRRDEGELFVPPDTSLAYVQKLKNLLEEEAAISRSRRDRFCCEAFDLGEADPLFPASWAPSAGIARRQSPAKLQWAPPQGGLLQARARLDAGAPGLERVLQTEEPVFDKAAEDGVRFRVYQVGSLELRTVQEPSGREVIGAVFSSCAPAQGPATYMGWNVQDGEAIVKATEYVESAQDGAQASAAPACRFYVVLETEKGNVIVTERLRDQTVTWEENPRALESRNYLAKVTRFSECRSLRAAVRDMRAYRAAEAQRAGLGPCQPDGASYAHGAFLRATLPGARAEPRAPVAAAQGFDAPARPVPFDTPAYAATPFEAPSYAVPAYGSG